MTKIVMREKTEEKTVKVRAVAAPKDTLFKDIILGLLVGLLIVIIVFL